jgi:tetratricopeptide (TPR) repeat protein
MGRAMARRIIQTLGILLIFVLVNVKIADANNTLPEIWKKAIQAYEQKQYENALQLFREIEKNGKVSSELYFNIGNCYYKLSQPGYAILYYERALLLNPTDPDIHYNLNLVRKQIPGLIKVPPKFFLLEWWDIFFDFMRFPVMVWIFIASFFLWNVLFGLKMLYRKSAKGEILGFVLKIVGWALIIELLILIFDYRHDYTHHFGIVTEPKVAVKSEPFDESTVLYYIVSGQKVELLRKLENWQEILLPDGNKGWIHPKDVARIEPETNLENM